MKILVSKEAIKWFKEEVGLEEGSAIRFYSQIYGTSPIQEGYALAFTIDTLHEDVAVQTVSEGLTFFIEDADLWFFNGHDLYVEYNNNIDELEYRYVKS
ncbi:HesB/YadR/YfhF family protein [Niallia circulans]|uniref:HesB/YadR/YfhF family protein n=1 Tax=Niallia circulans TaxID=1397 RepID=UPI000F4566B8|nr:HesB/YadR/YfhF family protein [Niallia circulans]AYV68699.1 HesB/YadR/YfhF family protein [Niallia circulans]